MLRRNPSRYLRWVGGGMRSGLSRLTERLTLTVPAVLLVLSAPLLLGARRTPRPGAGELRALAGLAVLCGSYFFFNMVLLATVSVPFERYVNAALLLLPSWLWIELALIWRRAAVRWRPG